MPFLSKAMNFCHPPVSLLYPTFNNPWGYLQQRVTRFIWSLQKAFRIFQCSATHWASKPQDSDSLSLQPINQSITEQKGRSTTGSRGKKRPGPSCANAIPWAGELPRQHPRARWQGNPNTTITSQLLLPCPLWRTHDLGPYFPLAPGLMEAGRVKNTSKSSLISYH